MIGSIAAEDGIAITRASRAAPKGTRFAPPDDASTDAAFFDDRHHAYDLWLARAFG